MKRAQWIWLLASGICLISSTAMAERRALVIGNDDYEHVRRLEKAVNDARALAATLREVGFANPVIKENLNRREMNLAIARFAASLGPDDEVVIYYAGHGADRKGSNYLLPVDFPHPKDIDVEAMLASESVRLGEMLEQVKEKRPRFSLIIVDACRDHPFPQLGTRGEGGKSGLANESPPKGMLLVYAAEPGKVALDYLRRRDEDANGVFMRSLLPLLKQPGVEIRTVLSQVRDKVEQVSEEKQFPNWHDLVKGKFCLIGPCLSTGENRQVLEDERRKMQDERERERQQWLSQREELARAQTAAHDVERAASRLKEALTEEKNAIKAQKDADIRKAQEAVDQANRQLEQAKDAQRQAEEALKARQGDGLSGQNGPILMAGGDPPGKEVVSPDSTYRDPVTGMEFVKIPAGCFQMGSLAKEKGRSDDEGPVHEVCVKEFWLGKHEVTNAEYQKWKSGHDSGEYGGNSLNGDTQPVVKVNWEEAQGYGEWLSGKGNGKYRLPTEAEWEYGARAGTKFSRYWGNGEKEACQYGNVADLTAKKKWSDWTIFDCDDGYAVTAPVGRFKPNGFGLHDMLGNVWEWTADWYGGKYYANSPKNNPTGPSSGSIRVIRGGSWNSNPAIVRSAYRNGRGPALRFNNVGFRLARTYP